MKPPISPQARSAYEAVCRPYDRCVEPPFALRREPGTIDRQLRELITKRNQRRCLPNKPAPATKRGGWLRLLGREKEFGALNRMIGALLSKQADDPRRRLFGRDAEQRD